MRRRLNRWLRKRGFRVGQTFRSLRFDRPQLAAEGSGNPPQALVGAHEERFGVEQPARREYVFGDPLRRLAGQGHESCRQSSSGGVAAAVTVETGSDDGAGLQEANCWQLVRREPLSAPPLAVCVERAGTSRSDTGAAATRRGSCPTRVGGVIPHRSRSGERSPAGAGGRATATHATVARGYRPGDGIAAAKESRASGHVRRTRANRCASVGLHGHITKVERCNRQHQLTLGRR